MKMILRVSLLKQLLLYRKLSEKYALKLKLFRQLFGITLKIMQACADSARCRLAQLPDSVIHTARRAIHTKKRQKQCLILQIVMLSKPKLVAPPNRQFSQTEVHR